MRTVIINGRRQISFTKEELENLTEEERNLMMQPEDIAQAVMDILALPQRTMVEELVLRPILGDLP